MNNRQKKEKDKKTNKNIEEEEKNYSFLCEHGISSYTFAFSWVKAVDTKTVNSSRPEYLLVRYSLKCRETK